MNPDTRTPINANAPPRRLTRVAATALMLGVVGACMIAAPDTPAATATAATLQVYAAGSQRAPLTTIAQAYTARTGTRVQLTFGSSGLLRQRIQHGAAADVFASADVAQPQTLAQGGGWHAPVVFARNQLCLLSPRTLSITSATALATLLKPGVSIGTSTPHADPSGDYTWQLFHKADALHPGAYATLDAKAQKLVGGANSPKLEPPAGMNALAWLMQRHPVDVFVTYCSSASTAAHATPQLKVTTLPHELAVHATDAVTWRERSPAAADFVKALQGAAGRRALEAAGFVAP